MLTTREFQLLRVSFFEYKVFHVSLIRTSLIASRRSLIRTSLIASRRSLIRTSLIASRRSLIRTSLIASRRSLIRTTLFEGSIIRMMRREAELLRQVTMFIHIIYIILLYIVAYMLAARPTRNRLVPGSIPTLYRLRHSAWYPAAALVYI
jgi:hypothetical protein